MTLADPWGPNAQVLKPCSGLQAVEAADRGRLTFITLRWKFKE